MYIAKIKTSGYVEVTLDDDQAELVDLYRKYMQRGIWEERVSLLDAEQAWDLMMDCAYDKIRKIETQDFELQEIDKIG